MGFAIPLKTVSSPVRFRLQYSNLHMYYNNKRNRVETPDRKKGENGGILSGRRQGNQREKVEKLREKSLV